MGYSKNFIALPKEALSDDRLNFRDLRILLAIISVVSWKDQKNKANPRVTTKREVIAERSGISLAAVTTHTARLQKFGWLSKSGNGGFSRPATYELLIPEIPHKLSPQSINTSPDSSYLDSEEGSHPENGEGSHPESEEGKEQMISSKENNQQKEIELTASEAQKLVDAGLFFSQIKNLFFNYSKELVFEKIDLLSMAKQKGSIHNPAGWIARALAENFVANPTAPQAESQASHLPFPSQAQSTPMPLPTPTAFVAPDPERLNAWLAELPLSSRKDFEECGFESPRWRGTYRAWATQKNH